MEDSNKPYANEEIDQLAATKTRRVKTVAVNKKALEKKMKDVAQSYNKHVIESRKRKATEAEDTEQKIKKKKEDTQNKKQQKSAAKTQQKETIKEEMQEEQHPKKATKKEKVKEKMQPNPLPDKAQMRAGHKPFLKWVAQLREAKRRAVAEIGFGSLLTLDMPASNLHFNASLIKNFEPSDSTMYLPRRKSFRITEEDVEIVYGLPRGDILIVEPSYETYTDEFTIFLADWRAFWGIDAGSPTVTDIVTKYTTELREQAPDVMFLLNFVVVAVNCLMSQKTGNNCHFRFLNSLMDVQAIKNLNWCKYVHDELISTTTEYKIKKQSFYKGPLFFLTLCYFDRVRKLGLQQPPRTAPLISSWNSKQIAERIKLEMSEGFGKGVVLERITAHKKEKKESMNAEKEMTYNEEEIDLETFFQNFLQEIREIGPRVRKLQKMVLKARKMLPNNNLAYKANAFITTIMRAAGENVETSILSQDKEVYDNPSFLAEVQRIEESILQEKMMHESNLQQQREQLTPSPNTPTKSRVLKQMMDKAHNPMIKSLQNKT